MMPAPAYGAPQVIVPTGQMTGADVWRVIRANLLLIVCSVVVFAILGFVTNVWLKKFYPRYTAVGVIEVQPNQVIDPVKSPLATADRATIEIEQRTQAELLKHPALLTEVLQTSDKIKTTNWYKQFSDVRDAKEDLQDKFEVTPRPDTKLIRVAMSYSNPKDCRDIVEELVGRHLRQENQKRREAQLLRGQTLTQLLGNYTVNLADLDERLRSKGSKLAMDGLGVPGRLNALESRASQLSQELARTENELQAVKSAYDQTTGQLQAGQEPAMLEEMLARDPLIVNYRQQLDNMDVALSEYIKLGEQHPYVKQITARREALMKKYLDARAEQLGKYRASYLDRMKMEVATKQLTAERQHKELEKIGADLAALTEDLNVYLSTLEEQKALRETIKSINKEIEDIKAYNMRADQAGVFWAQHPDVPDTISFPRLGITMSLAIMLGLAASVGLAFLREMLDTSVRSPRDIARVGQMNVLGMVPNESDDPQVAGVRLPLAIFEAPTSAFAEQLRQIRTRLQHTVSLDTTRAILVTSAGPDDGKTTIAANLAAGLALNGRKILLVDANFRRPQLHNVFGIGNDAGFSDALNAPDSFASFTKETPIPNLAVLPCGAKPANATELLESQLLIDFIDRALDEYDHVIFDSGPMLFVSETVAMAPRVDGVVTVVRAQQNSRGALQRLRDGLRQIKAQHIGVVLNAVRAQGGGYYAQNIRTHYEYQGLPAKQG
jgi:tyrosine-protein kinase Etk/Wzc